MQLLGAHEAFARADARLIERFIENSVVEKKSGRVKGAVLAEYFSMWANTAPEGGLILVGVENDGTKTGLVGLSDRQIADIELAGPNLCPDARFEQKRIEIINNKGQPDILILFYIKFNAGRVVETHKRRAFIRRGDEKHELSDLEKNELRIDRGEIDFEDEFCGLEYPSDFRLDEIKTFSENVCETFSTNSPRTDEEVLQMRRLGKIVAGKFRPNTACALLFANDPAARFPGCKIRFFQFDGDEEGTGAKFNATKDIWIEGTIPELISGARTVIKSQIRDYTRLGPNGKFFRGPEYPEDAWYEAVVNACVHRSYNMRNSTVFVKLFYSRLEIESPGASRPGLLQKTFTITAYPETGGSLRRCIALNTCFARTRAPAGCATQ
jgi:ATP-dependent DNA helicase RecG